MSYVIVDWRPYDIPSVYGPFDVPEDAQYAWDALVGDLDDEGTLPDGVDIVELDSSSLQVQVVLGPDWPK